MHESETATEKVGETGAGMGVVKALVGGGWGGRLRGRAFEKLQTTLSADVFMAYRLIATQSRVKIIIAMLSIAGRSCLGNNTVNVPAPTLPKFQLGE